MVKPNDIPRRADQGVVFSIKRYALHDGPGIRTTVFLKGCPLRCWWCHTPRARNPEPETVRDHGDKPFSAFAGPDGRVGRMMTIREVMEVVRKDELFYDESGGGVTFSGGEPLMQPGFLHALLTAAKALDLRTAVDTSGFAAPEVLERILPLTDLFLYDLKLMDDDRHRRYAGTPVEPILNNLDLLARSGARVHVRVPVVPGITDAEDNLDAIAVFLSERPALGRVALLALNHLGDQKYQRLGMENRNKRAQAALGRAHGRAVPPLHGPWTHLHHWRIEDE